MIVYDNDDTFRLLFLFNLSHRRNFYIIEISRHYYKSSQVFKTKEKCLKLKYCSIPMFGDIFERSSIALEMDIGKFRNFN